MAGATTGATTLASFSNSPSGVATQVTLPPSTSSSAASAAPATTSQLILYYDRTPTLDTSSEDYFVIWAYDATMSTLDICSAPSLYNGTTSDWSDQEFNPTAASPTIPTPGVGETFYLTSDPPGQSVCRFEVDNFGSYPLKMRLVCLTGLSQNIMCDGYAPGGYNDWVQAPCPGSTN